MSRRYLSSFAHAVCVLQTLTILAPTTPTSSASELATVNVGSDGSSSTAPHAGVSTTLNSSAFLTIQHLQIQMHAFAVREMRSGKFNDKPGALLGSQELRAQIQSRAGPVCSRQRWRRAIESSGLTQATTFDRIFALGIGDGDKSGGPGIVSVGGNQCNADQLYHFVGSGPGSWISNIVNVIYNCHAANQTCSWYVGDPRRDRFMAARWETLFEHRLPLCRAPYPLTDSKRSRPMVRPDGMAALKKKDVCAYAATRSFFTRQLWDILTTALAMRAEYVRRQRRQAAVLAALAAVATPETTETDTGVGSAGNGEKPHQTVPQYIGVHLRHKWEFSIQPPRLEDVAKLIGAVAAHVNPTAPVPVDDSSNVFDAALLRARVGSLSSLSSPRSRPEWGDRVVVLCASDDVEACTELQRQLDLLSTTSTNDRSNDNSDNDNDSGTSAGFVVHATTGLKNGATQDGLHEYAMDVGLLRAAAVFLGTGSSNLSRLVNALRGPEKLSLSMDIDFNAICF